MPNKILVSFFSSTPHTFLFKVCEEKLQYSLSENVQTNVLWGSTITDSVILHPWAETNVGTATDAANEEALMETQRFAMYVPLLWVKRLYSGSSVKSYDLK